MSSIKKSDLPFGSEFSPSQIELPILLEIAHDIGGDWKEFEQRVKETFFEYEDTSEYNRGKLANNCKLGMIAYGIIDRDSNLTKFGSKLYNIKNDETKLYETLSRHILLNLHGINLVQCVLDMQISGESVTLIKLRSWLEERGIHFPSGGKHPSIMRLWLEKSGVFKSGWNVDEFRLEEIVGKSIEEIETIASFSPEQKAYLKSLSNIGGSGPFLSNEIQKLASATYGVTFDEKNLPKQVLYPLQDAGYIKLTRGTKYPGRGAKPFFIKSTNKLKSDLIDPIIRQLEKQFQSDLRPLLRKSLPEILDDINSKDKHKRGLALEALAFKLLRLLDMSYVATRLRGTATGGTEVDLIFQSPRLVFSRWQVQCKKTSKISLDDVAKEVGLMGYFNSQVAVVIGTGRISKLARKYTELVRNESGKHVILMGRKDILGVVNGETPFCQVLESQIPFVLMQAN